MSPRNSTSAATAGAPRGRLRRMVSPTNLLTSLILVFPLFLFYELAVLALGPAQVGNGADLVTPQLLRLLHGSPGLELAWTGALAVVFVLVVVVLRRKQRFDARLFAPVVIESSLYAMTMGAAICYVMGLLGISPTLAVPFAGAVHDPKLPASVLARIAIAVGAGVHEEIVFRLLLLSALFFVGERLLGMKRWLALVFAFVLSSAMFSAAHQVIGGEPWKIGSLVYRFFCGLVFAALFRWRGLAVAVYTHALYDVYVMLLH